jgi:hypothetical protein
MGLAGPVERAAARAFLAEILELLATGNLSVLERFAARGHALDALSNDSLNGLQAALQSFNMERARQLCEAQIQILATA